MSPSFLCIFSSYNFIIQDLLLGFESHLELIFAHEIKVQFHSLHNLLKKFLLIECLWWLCWKSGDYKLVSIFLILPTYLIRHSSIFMWSSVAVITVASQHIILYVEIMDYCLWLLVSLAFTQGVWFIWGSFCSFMWIIGLFLQHVWKTTLEF